MEDKEKQIDPRVIEFSKGMSYLQSVSRISECFYHQKNECKGKIKQAHSLQNNGRLSVLEGDVDGEKKIYTFTSFIPSSQHLISDLKPVGRKSASTFFGFCDYHDSVLFAPIENHAYDESDKHNFLHSYRSFAHTYHKRKEGLKGLQNKDKFQTPLDASKITGYSLSIIDAEKAKTELDRMIENESYSELEYLTYVIEGKTFPIACASIVTPRFFYDNKPFNNHLDESVPYSDIMLTVLPDRGQTIIILACLPGDKLGARFLDQLARLPDLKFEKAISSLIISSVENTFFSPDFWEALGLDGKKQLLREVEWNVIEHSSPHYSLTKFYHSKINLFNPKFCVENFTAKANDSNSG